MDKAWRRFLPMRPLPWWGALRLAAACVAAGAGVRAAGGAFFGGDLPFISFFPAILVAAVWGGFSGGLAAVVGSAVAAYLMFMDRRAGIGATAWALGSFLLSGGLLVLVGGLLGRAVRALAISEERFRSLVLASAQMVIRLDPTGGRLTSDGLWTEFTGLAGEESSDWRAAIHADDQALVPPLERKTVQAEVRLRHAGPSAYRWVRISLTPVSDGGRPSEWLGAIEDIHERKVLEEQRLTLAQELTHRAKNGFAVVQAIVSQSARGATTVAEMEKILTSRLNAMALAQELVSVHPGESAPLEELLPNVLAPFDLSRFDLAAAPMTVGRTLSMTLALVVHELATNAVKYGSLSGADGRVKLEVRRPDDGRAEISWREFGGPPPLPPGRSGFGTRLLQSALSAYGGAAETRYEPGGLVCTLSFTA